MTQNDKQRRVIRILSNQRLSSPHHDSTKSALLLYLGAVRFRLTDDHNPPEISYLGAVRLPLEALDQIGRCLALPPRPGLCQALCIDIAKISVASNAGNRPRPPQTPAEHAF